MNPVDYIVSKVEKGKQRKVKGITVRKDSTGMLTTIKQGNKTRKIVNFGGR